MQEGSYYRLCISRGTRPTPRLYFLHSTHPTQKAAVQCKDDLRQAKENERNRFNSPDNLILCRSPVRIVDEAGSSRQTEPVPDTTDPLLT